MKPLKPKTLILPYCFAAALLVLSQPEAQAQTRPVYIVAHRCNSADMSVVREHGVNAIEADFRYGGGLRTTGWYLAHDDVLPTSPTLDEWLAVVKAEASRLGTPLSLLHVDIKTPKKNLDELFDKVRAALPSLYLIWDIGLVKDGDYLDPINNRILNDPRSAAAMGFDDSPQDVNNFFNKKNYPMHKYWYEVGLAAGFKWSEGEQNWTRQAIKARDAGKGPKVLIWTFESESTVKYWLQTGVDGILVNSSKAYGRTTAFATNADVHVRNAKAMGSVKFATPSDNALQIVAERRKDYALVIRTGDKFQAATDSNIYVNIIGPDGQTGEQRVNSLISGDAFVRDRSDKLTLKNMKDVGKPTKIKVRSDGKYGGAGWYLAYIAVDSRPARFYRWIEGDKLSAEAPVVDK